MPAIPPETSWYHHWCQSEVTCSQAPSDIWARRLPSPTNARHSLRRGLIEFLLSDKVLAQGLSLPVPTPQPHIHLSHMPFPTWSPKGYPGVLGEDTWACHLHLTIKDAPRCPLQTPARSPEVKHLVPPGFCSSHLLSPGRTH